MDLCAKWFEVKKALVDQTHLYPRLLGNTSYLAALKSICNNDGAINTMDYRHLWVASNKELSTVWKTTNSAELKEGVSTNVLSGLWSNEVHDAVLGLRKDGFYVMKVNISEELIASLRNNLSPKYVTPSGVKSGLIQQKYTELATKASHV